MASSTNANRPLIGWLLLVAGAVLLLGQVGVPFISFVAAAALVVAFVLLFVSPSVSTIGRVAFLLTAAGWALLAVAGLIGIDVLAVAATLLILVGSLGSGIIAYLRSLFTPRATTWFLIAMILAAVEMLNTIVSFIPGVAGLVVGFVFAATLVVAGLFIAQRR